MQLLGGIQIFEHVDLLYNAHCTQIQKKESVCEAIQIENSNNYKLWICSPQLYLANGGIESVRFLLLHFPESSKHIGMGFMEHPCKNLGEISIKNDIELQRCFGTKIKNQHKYGIRLTPTAAFNTNKKIINGSYSLMFETPDEEFDIYREAKQFSKLKLLIKLVKLQISPFTLARTIFELIKHYTIYRPKAKTTLIVMLEQIWSANSTLSLNNNEVDCFDQPIIEVNWQIDDSTIKAMEAGCFEVVKYLRQNFGPLEFKPTAINQNVNIKESLSPVNHHMGGASIGLVVDNRLKLMNFNNVYVCSSSVFPSSSHSNPTLTTLALVSRAISLNNP